MGTSRRDFLKLQAAAFFSPIEFLTNQLCSERLFNCHESAHDRYILFHLAGAPPRWAFDDPLAPQKNSKFKANPMIVTEFDEAPFSNSEAVSFSYKTKDVFGYQMPSFWHYPLDPSLGREGSLSQILENALIIRGCRMGVDGHSINARKISRPNPNMPSLSGLIADHYKKPLPAVGMSETHYPTHVTPIGAFSSANSNSISVLDKHITNYYDYLFHDFISSGDRNSESQLVDFILSRKKVLSPEIEIKRSQAKSLFKLNLRKLREKYISRVNTYESIIKSSQSNFNLKGLTDKVIPGLELDRVQKGKNLENVGSFLLDDNFLCDGDLRQAVKKMTLHGLAQQFALAEFLILNNIASTINIDLPSPTDLDLTNGLSTQFFNETKYNFSKKANTALLDSPNHRLYSFDAHNSGLIPHHLFTGVFYYVFTNCLDEFIDVLKTQKVAGRAHFESTLIHITSEFGRIPRPDKLGSEHGFNGQVNTFLSGKINQFKIIGNIQETNLGTDKNYFDVGTWGEGAPIKFLNNRPVVYGNIASSIATMMGIKSPTPKDPSLVGLKGGKVITLTEECENIG